MDTIRPRTGLALPSLERSVRDPEHGGPDAASSAATRYLCVGAHVDPEFADRVVRDVLEDRHRAVCPSRGIDLVPIVRHCLASRRRRLVRDLAILGVLAASLVVRPLPTAALAVTAWSCWLLYRLVKGWTSRGPGRSLLLLAALAGALYLAALVAGVALHPALAALRVPDVERQVLGFLLLPLGVWAVVLVEAARTRDVLVKQLSRRAYDPDHAPAEGGASIQWRLEDLARELYGNATIYSTFVPFVGSGAPFDTWSLVIDLQRPSRRGPILQHDPTPAAARLRAADFQARVAARLRRLGDARLDDGDGLAGLQFERHVFVDGSSLRGSLLFLPDSSGAPQLHLGDTDIERFADEQTGPARQYLDVRIGSWGEELVVTVHLRFATIGHTLYVEAVSCVLPPIKGAYHVVDAMPSRMTPGALLDLAAAATRTFPSVFCRAPVRVGGALLAPIRRWLEHQRTLAAIRESLAFDYGARTSVRELGAASGHHNHFQDLDVEKYRKLVDLHVLQAVGDHLDDEGVDASAFREQRMRILEHRIHLESAIPRM
jgi:hypothetical protein